MNDTVTCPHCKKMFSVEEMYMDVEYGVKGAEKIYACPYCLGDL